MDEEQTVLKNKKNIADLRLLQIEEEKALAKRETVFLLLAAVIHGMVHCP